MLYLYVEAPFAAFRTFTAGWYRPSAGFITPSAAYGLLLNAAGIESRLPEGADGHDGKVPTSLTRFGLPAVEIAIGSPPFRLRGRDRRLPVPEADFLPRTHTVFQQLHNYPVGASGAERADDCKGNKYNITPVRREFLSDLRAVIAVRGNEDLEDRVRRGLAGAFNENRYGVPFLGDNAFLIDRMELLADPGPLRWYERISAAAGNGVRNGTTRLTILIDRADLSRTTSALFAPTDFASQEIPTAAWTAVNPPQEAMATAAPKKRS